jgi:hypothetical protein
METRFIRFGAICSVLLAATTFLLWLLPRFVEPAATFEARLALADNPFHMGRLWVNFIHMFFALGACLAIHAVLREKARGFAALGMSIFFIWVLVELLALSINIFGVNMMWRAGYAAATPEQQAIYKTLLTWWPGAWDGLYFLLGLAYLLGSLVFGSLAVVQKGFTRLVGALILLGAPISAGFLIGGYGGPAWPETIAGAIYPVVQPLARLITGVWLWKMAPAARA